MDGSNLENETT